MALKKVRLLAGGSQYGIFDHWQRALKSGFEANGVEADVLSIFQEAVLPPDDDVVSLGFNLIRHWEAPLVEQKRHVVWGVDNPAYCYPFFQEHLKKPNVEQSTLLGFVDRTRCRLADEVLGFSGARFLPHGASAPFCSAEDWGARPLDTVFFGSLGSLEESEQKLLKAAASLSSSAVGLMQAMIRDFTFESSVPSDFIFWEILKKNLSAPVEPLRRIFMFLFVPLDRYLRIRHRIRFLSALKDTPIHIFGNGEWDQVELHGDSAVHEPLDHVQVCETMQRSKIVINNGPVFPEGSHERVFDALHSGCAVLSTPSLYFTEEFGDGSGVFICPAGEEAGMSAQIADCLGVDRREEIRAGQTRVCRAHTMTVRSRQILQMIERRWGLQMEKEFVCAE